MENNTKSFSFSSEQVSLLNDILQIYGEDILEMRAKNKRYGVNTDGLTKRYNEVIELSKILCDD